MYIWIKSKGKYFSYLKFYGLNNESTWKKRLQNKWLKYNHHERDNNRELDWTEQTEKIKDIREIFGDTKLSDTSSTFKISGLIIKNFE